MRLNSVEESVMLRFVPVLLSLAATTGCGADAGQRPAPEVHAQPRTPTCELPKAGPVSIEQLPEGSSVVECDAVGRIVVWRDAGVTVPAPGEGLDVFTEQMDSGSAPGSFGISVSEDGFVSYEFHDGSEEGSTANPDATALPASMSRRPEAIVLFSGRIAYPHVTIRTWACAPFRIQRAVRVNEEVLRVIGHTAPRCRTEVRRRESIERLTAADRVGGQGVGRVVLVDTRAGSRVVAKVLHVTA